jgi:drug/metabolite transporter (DMT)-like permease
MSARVVLQRPRDLSRRSLHRAYLGVAFAAASWGTWTVFLRLAHATGPIAPELSTFIVFASIGLVLCPLAARAARERETSRSWRDWSLCAVFGVSDALNCVLYFAALQTTSVAVAVLTHYLAPLLVAVMAPLVLGERRRPGTLLAVGVGLLGLTLLLAPWNIRTQPDGTLLTGALLGLGSAFFYAINVLLNKRLTQSFDPAEIFVYHMPSALLLLGLLVPAGAWAVSSQGFVWLVIGALGPGALAGIVFVRGLAVVPAAHASVLTLVEPFAAIAIARFAWGETLAPSALIGAAAILIAAYLVVRQASGVSLRSAIAMPASRSSGGAGRAARWRAQPRQ